MTPTPAHLLAVAVPLAAGYAGVVCWGVRRDDLRRRLRAFARAARAFDCSGLVVGVRLEKAFRQAAAAFALFGDAIMRSMAAADHPSAGLVGHVHFPPPPLGVRSEPLAWPLGDAQRVAALADEELAAWARFIADTKEQGR